MPIPEFAKRIVYGGVEICTLGRGVPRRICGEPIRFPARWSRAVPSHYEPLCFDFVRRYCRPGTVAFDIGANIGVFTVAMARRVGGSGKVFAFEPTPRLRDTLIRVLRLNGVADQVQVRAEAVGGRIGEAEFYDTGHLGAVANSLVARADARHYTVAVTTVDATRHAERVGRVAAIKIDVEGAEVEVLRGAEQTLAEDKPAINLGVHPKAIRAAGENLESLWHLIVPHGYRMEHDGEVVERQWFCAQEELFDVQCVAA
jgi:FkbM family methyltransferase